MPQSRAPCLLTAHDGQEHIPQALLFMPHMPLLLEHPELRPDRGITGVTREAFLHLRCRSAPEFVNDVHDLPLSAAQYLVWFLRHRRPCASKVASCYKSSTY